MPDETLIPAPVSTTIFRLLLISPTTSSRLLMCDSFSRLGGSLRMFTEKFARESKAHLILNSFLELPMRQSKIYQSLPMNFQSVTLSTRDGIRLFGIRSSMIERGFMPDVICCCTQETGPKLDCHFSASSRSDRQLISLRSLIIDSLSSSSSTTGSAARLCSASQ